MGLVQCPDCSREVSDQAVSCPQCGYPFRAVPGEPEFHAHRKRVLIGCTILCAVVGLPAGIALEQPWVIILSLVGIAVGGFKLRRLRGN
ncbi:MAG: zinc-ribbon domain-containing protein [Candidatus Hydrogenedentes bacterium]|nr:zinc-ribbon domain-containing protein [Candidatus Hydrogenedentota bacterium]